MKKVFGMLLLVAALFLIAPMQQGYAEKSDMDIAQELIYGQWSKKCTDGVQHVFSEKNIRILNVMKVDPMGSSRIKVQMKNRDGAWITFNTTFFINLVNDRYELQIVKRRDNGNAVLDGEENKTFVKVNW